MSAERATWEDRDRLRGQIERLRGLINIRWVAVFGVAAASVATELVGYKLSIWPPWSLVPGVIGYNVLFLWWLRRTGRAYQEEAYAYSRLERSLRWQGYLQALCDMMAMILLVYLDGGVEYPLFYAPLLAVMLSSLILPLRGLLIQANFGAALFALMALGEYQGWVPHVIALQPPYRYGLYLDLPAVLARVLSTVVMLNVAAFLMSRLAQRMNQAEEHTRHLLGRLRRQVGAASRRLAHASQDMHQSAQEVNLVAEQIAVTVQEIAQGAGEQAGQLERLSRSLDHLFDAARRIDEGARETHEASENAVSTADRGRQAAVEATGRMGEVARDFARAEEALADLARRSEEIAEVALAIDRFAERTDLLALNAGIEAARAGEHGRGFAVVAGEVKKLAASSSSSAEQVAGMVVQVQDEIKRVVGSVQAGIERVQEGREAIATLQEVVDGMGAVVSQAAELAGTMDHLSNQQIQSHREIVRAVENLASTAEETAAGAEETAAAVEEQVATFADFGKAVDDLAGLAAQMDQALTSLYETDVDQ